MDGTKVTVNGLTEIFAELFAEGRPADFKVSDEIMNRLETKQNYIPSSEITRREYRHLILKEYREYLSAHEGGT
ncbi:MAG: hypothetical protein C4576_26850 [Desulfobacteraceae bacterium]|nr:MAG: hypothetical protein C4576_26850 [Desulfobacteraceae bacterium]